MNKGDRFPVPMRKNVLKRAIEVYGKESRTDLAVEEMSELTQALMKERRASKAQKQECTKNIYEEMADVIIMLEQLFMVFGGREEVQKNIESKTDRLAKRISRKQRTNKRRKER